MVISDLKIVDSKTMIPLGAMVTLGIALAQALFWLNGLVNQIAVNTAVLKAVQIEQSTNRWMCSDHERWVYKLQIANPKLVLPSIDKDCEGR